MRETALFQKALSKINQKKKIHVLISYLFIPTIEFVLDTTLSSVDLSTLNPNVNLQQRRSNYKLIMYLEKNVFDVNTNCLILKIDLKKRKEKKIFRSNVNSCSSYRNKLSISKSIQI